MVLPALGPPQETQVDAGAIGVSRTSITLQGCGAWQNKKGVIRRGVKNDSPLQLKERNIYCLNFGKWRQEIGKRRRRIVGALTKPPEEKKKANKAKINEEFKR